jgi:transcriptional regulator GlxA family with amidase domain
MLPAGREKSVCKNDIIDTILAMRIFVLALDGVFDTGLAIVLDTLAMANELAQANAMPGIHFETSLVSARPKVQTAQGLSVATKSAARAGSADVVVIPALGAKMPDTLGAALSRPEIQAAAGQLVRWAERDTLIVAACTSTFVLAETSLLAGHRATTTWWLAPMFRQRYPSIKLDESRMLVESAGFVTAGAALAHLDAALSIVRRRSPVLAALCARYLLVEPRPSQAPFIIPDHLAHADPLVERFERWARHHLARGFSLEAASAAIGASPRTLARRLSRVLGRSPLQYFQDLRVERATHLLQTSRDSIEQIASKVGYADAVTLRALLRKRTGHGVREIRARKKTARGLP